MHRKPQITGRQCQAARALIGWKQADLAEASNASIRTICSFETGKSTPHQVTVDAIMSALIYNGVMFLPEGGVNLRPEFAQREDQP